MEDGLKTLFTWLIQQGAVGVLAAVFLALYVLERWSHERTYRRMSEKFSSLVDAANTVNVANQKVITDNTVAMSRFGDVFHTLYSGGARGRRG